MSSFKDKNGLSEEQFLEKYNPENYKRPSVTTDILILRLNEDYSSLKILLVKRDEHPYLDCWALPGGFIHENETAYQAALRIMAKKTGQESAYLDQIYTFTKPGRDPRTRVMSIAYLSLVSGSGEMKGTDDLPQAVWFDLKFTDTVIELANQDEEVQIVYDLKKETFSNGMLRYDNYTASLRSEEGLAFDHVEIVIESIKKLREQLFYGGQAFCLVEEKFTLPELQAAYEAVLGHPVYKKSFRDMISSQIAETGNEKKSRIKGGRTSKEYQYKG